MNTSSAKNSKRPNIRSLFDLIMGSIYAIVGCLLVYSKFKGQKLSFPPSEMMLMFGVASILYGAFRIFRGSKTLYSE